VTDPAQIAKESRAYNDQGIDLSTIGVGLDLNKDLLHGLAKSGRGLFHFVADSQDIEKVFVNEVHSLMSPVATAPNLTIEFDSTMKLDQVYGYDPKVNGNVVRIKLDNMNSGMTEIVLMRFRCGAREESIPIKVRLSYYDLERKKQITKTVSDELMLEGRRARGPFEDMSVAKNYTIAELAQSIFDMAEACEKNNFRQAEKYLNRSISSTNERYPNLQDPDIKRTYDIAKTYQDALQKENRARGNEEDRDEPLTMGDNLIFNGDFSLGNVGFKSCRTYVDPAPNCLWNDFFTIAPKFNDPQLHRLIANQEYAAPKQLRGRANVFYVNDGGSQIEALITTEVKCRPHTKYRLSFLANSLTPGREWISTYEIRIEGARSEPQPAGEQQYNEIKMVWDSGNAISATVEIMRMFNPHGGGIVGIANFEMVEIK
jgi:hypothetical protein